MPRHDERKLSVIYDNGWKHYILYKSVIMFSMKMENLPELWIDKIVEECEK